MTTMATCPHSKEEDHTKATKPGNKDRTSSTLHKSTEIILAIISGEIQNERYTKDR